LTDEQRSKLFLRDMLSYARLVNEFIEGVSKEEFEKNTEKQFAVVRALEVIGEAAKNVPEVHRSLAPEVPWKQISAMRDKLIHHYFGVRFDTVWTVATREVQDLIVQLNRSWLSLNLQTMLSPNSLFSS
jgi:uncharacterized protein with HEPN domain